MTRHHLRQHERARSRLDYAIRERERFEARMDIENDEDQRRWRKLHADVRRAQEDVGYLQNALDEPRGVEQVSGGPGTLQ